MIRTIALSLLLLASCKSTEGHDHAAATADQVVMVGHCAGQTQLALDQSLNGLKKVDATRGEDPTPAFKEFSSAYDSFTGELADLRKQRAGLSTKAESWFSEFELKNSAIQDEDLREDGAKRLAEFRERIGETSKQVDELIKGASDVDKTLGDLRTYLGNDLSPEGVKAASGKISDVTKDGHKVAEKLGELSKASEALAAKMRAARKPAEAKK
jgi:phage-related tail protein